jgi:hypothetical protein
MADVILRRRMLVLQWAADRCVTQVEVRGFEPLTSTLRTDSDAVHEPMAHNGFQSFSLVRKGRRLAQPYISMPLDCMIRSTSADKMRT